MASYTPWAQLNARQRKLALQKWHERQTGKAAGGHVDPADTNPLYNPTVTLTGGALKSAVDQLVSNEFAPARHALTQQAATSTAQNNALAARVAGYTGAVDKRAGVATAREQAINDQLQHQLEAVSGNAMLTADKVQAEEGLRRQAETALQAAPAGTPDPAMEELAALRARSAANAQAAQGAGAVMGANYEGLANSTRGAIGLRGQEQQTEIANRLANDLAQIRAKKTDVASQAGAEKVKQLLGLRQSGFENLITAKGLGIKQTQLQADIVNQRKQLALAQQRQLETVNQNNINNANTTADNKRADQALANTEAKDAYQRENNLGPYKPPASKTPAQENADSRKLKAGIENARQDFAKLLKTPDKKGNKRSVQRVQEILANRGAPPIVILAAGDLARYGYVTKPHLKSLEIAGVKIPKGWRSVASGVKGSVNASGG